MDGDDLELFERSLRHATESPHGRRRSTPPSPSWAGATRWRSTAAPRSRCCSSSRARPTSRPRRSTTSSLGALGVGPADDRASCCRPSAGGAHPASSTASASAVAGLGTAALADQQTRARRGRRPARRTVAVVVAHRRAHAPAGRRHRSAGSAWCEVTAGAIDHRCRAAARRRVGRRPSPLAQLALGHELVGAARTMLELAREHALERIQFGQPISMFQAVRHRLADTLVAIETADAVLDAAWLDQSPADRGHGQGARRSRRPHGGPPLPAGARRHRVHHRAPAAPLRPPGPRARRALRRRPLAHQATSATTCSPPASCRRTSPSDASAARTAVGSEPRCRQRSG